jgi:hypothetical protein
MQGPHLKLALGILAALLTLRPLSAASIRFDLRAVQDGTVGAAVHDPKNVHVTSPDGVVQMQVWAMVENPNGINEDDEFAMTQLSFLSTARNLRGDLLATNIPFFSWPEPDPGRQVDLDGDGDLDVGDNRLQGGSSRPWPWFVAAGSFLPWSAVPDALKAAEIEADQAYSSFLIGSLSFSFQDLIPSLDLTTAISARPRARIDGIDGFWKQHIFVQDGTRFGLTGTDPRVTTGAPVNITTIPTHMPEPATWLLAIIGLVALCAYRCRMRLASLSFPFVHH